MQDRKKAPLSPQPKLTGNSHKVLLYQLRALDKEYQDQLYSTKARFKRLEILINFYNNYPQEAIRRKVFYQKECEKFNLPFDAAFLLGDFWNYRKFKQAIKEHGDDAYAINQFYQALYQKIQSLNVPQKIVALDLNDEEGDRLYALLEDWEKEGPNTVKEKFDAIKDKKDLFRLPDEYVTPKFTFATACPQLLEILNDTAYWQSKVHYSSKAAPDGIVEMRTCLKQIMAQKNLTNRNAKILSSLKPIAEKSAKRTYRFFADRRDPMTALLYTIFKNDHWESALQAGGDIEKLIEDYQNFRTQHNSKTPQKPSNGK